MYAILFSNENFPSKFNKKFNTKKTYVFDKLGLQDLPKQLEKLDFIVKSDIEFTMEKDKLGFLSINFDTVDAPIMVDINYCQDGSKIFTQF